MVNIGLNLALMGPLGHVGIALATTLSGWLNVALLATGLVRRGFLRPDARLRRRLPRMIAAAAGMAGLLWGVAFALESPLEAQGLRIAALAALVVAGLVAYGALAALSGAVSPREVWGLLHRRRESGG